MRYVIFGAGAIGGAIGGKLASSGCEVVLIARGAHLEALKSNGLELADPDSKEAFSLPAYGSPAEVDLEEDDCVLMAMKSQQTEAALDDLRAAAPGGISVVCAQNGVENERLALRRFERVYGMRVLIAATHLEPGKVEIATAPVFGILDVGRFPSGSDEVAEELASDLKRAGFDARVQQDVMSFKYLKLLGNLGNSLQAAIGPSPGEAGRAIYKAAEKEARDCYAACGVTVADEEAETDRRSLRGMLRPVNGSLRRGGSSWQSLERQTGNIEADYLNGEIVLMGRTHDVATPVNAFLQRLAVELARKRRPAGSIGEQELAERLAVELGTPI